jgi:hypothetical protein
MIKMERMTETPSDDIDNAPDGNERVTPSNRKTSLPKQPTKYPDPKRMILLLYNHENIL